MEINFKPNYAIHPGVFLKEEMEMMGITQKALAETTGVSKTIINEVINGKRKIGAELAVKLEKALYSPAKYWLNLQAIYDETVARLKLGEWEQRMTVSLEIVAPTAPICEKGDGNYLLNKENRSAA